MSIEEQWQQMRKATTATEQQLLEQFIPWTEEFTAAENDTNGAFSHWRSLEKDTRLGLLKEAIGGTIVSHPKCPQVELGFLYALYQLLCHRRTFICCPLTIDTLTIRHLSDRINAIEKLRIDLLGHSVSAGHRHLSDCQNCDFAFADYFQFFSAVKRQPDIFKSQVQAIFILEGDFSLYANRIMAFEHSIPKATGIVYKSTGKMPDSWTNKEDILDIMSFLNDAKLTLAGSSCHIDPYIAQEDNFVMKSAFRKPLKGDKHLPYSAFTYRSNEERASGVTIDVAKAKGNALIICYSDPVLAKIQEEFRKSGLDYTFTTRSADINTFFEMKTGDDKRRIMIFRGLPSPLVFGEKPLCDGAIFIAEHFVSMAVHDKLFSFSKLIFNETQTPRIYFSLEDSLFAIYEEDAQFKKLFNIIEFTEKYDPWKQIRRVLAKAMLNKLHKVRMACLNEEMVVFTTSLVKVADYYSTGFSQQQQNKMAKASVKMEALCFCGSGKPFKECHGKRK
ncbi:MAG: SEC-C domain-containing protein [Lentisphaeria bacterium]|nr:SEC-C domain-containing protein [Lentisphaeria bacterium]